MSVQDKKIITSLYLRGHDLDPAVVSVKLGVSATCSQRRGETKLTSTNHEVTTKIGMWGLTAITESQTLSDHIEELASRVTITGDFIRSIPGVQEAYIDIFVAPTFDKDDDPSCEFELNEQDVVALRRINLPVRFTVTFSAED